METFQVVLAKKLSDALAQARLPIAGELTPATDPRFGDYQTNVALILGKQRGEKPQVLAEQIVAQFNAGDVCEPPVVAGAGFINFVLRPGAVAEKTMEVLRDERLGVAKAKSTQRIVIDFGSPNVAKPMHVGHIRSTVLGDALARIAQFLGHEGLDVAPVGLHRQGLMSQAELVGECRVEDIEDSQPEKTETQDTQVHGRISCGGYLPMGIAGLPSKKRTVGRLRRFPTPV